MRPREGLWFGFKMESATEDREPHTPSIQSPTDQPPFQQNSLKERGSDVEKKPFGIKGKTFSSQLRDSCTPRRGSQSKTGEENSEETALKGRANCIAPSDSEGCSNQESSRHRKTSSGDSARDTTGASLDERSMTLQRKKWIVPDADHSGETEETRDASPRRPQRRSTGRNKRPRSRSPGDQPPPLRKTLLTSLRAISEGIYQDVVQLQIQQVHSPLTWEQLAQLARLRGPLYDLVQTFYTMATQAAYVFPAEDWLVPAPLPGPQGSAENGGEAWRST